MSLQEKIPDLVAVCCILHNYILIHDEEGAEIVYDENDNDDQQELRHVGIHDDPQPNRGTLKRNYIASMLE